MQFSGPIRNDSEGIYYTSYKNNGQTRYIVATEFHPIHARKVFPCFDEPAMKARFSLSVTKPSGRYTVMSNNHWITNNDKPHNVDGVTYDTTKFPMTQKMSTYALGFIISDFKQIGKKIDSSNLYVAFLKQGSVNNSADFALEMTNNLTKYFRNIFDVRYHLPIQFLVGFPEFDDTKNIGLRLIKESRLVYGSADHNIEDKEIVVRHMAYLSAYELLGNVVTPRWWDDAWLAEGFASYYEHVGEEQFFPDMDTWQHFIIDKLQVALEYDGTFDGRPVFTRVQTPKQIEKLFNWVIFRKAPCLVRMLAHFVGVENFQRAMAQYVKSSKYASASHETFFSLLNTEVTASGMKINVTAIMETWILQINYPVVTVARDFNKPNAITVIQERFLTNPLLQDSDKYPSPFHYHWTIPLTFAIKGDPIIDTKPEDIYWITKDQRTNTFESDKFIPSGKGLHSDNWILANVKQSGYYRVNYPEGNWLALITQLKLNHAVIDTINRAQIIDDAFNLAKAKQLRMEIALQTLEYLDTEDAFLPWFTGWKHLSYIDSMLSYTPLYGSFQKLMKQWMDSAFFLFRLKNAVEGHMNQFAQSLITQLACHYGVKVCVTKTTEMFDKFMSTESKDGIFLNLRRAVYCQGVAGGEWEEWKFVLKMYKKTEVESEKDNLLSALSCTTHPWILRHYLDMLLEKDSPFSPDDGLNIITSIIRNVNGRYLAWDFYRTHYLELKKRYPVLACDLAIASITEYFNTDMEFKEVEIFYHVGCTSYLFSKFTTEVLDNIASNIDWLEANQPILRKWLHKHSVLGEFPSEYTPAY
ncbi:hypothetical protein BsWGS_03964 [Bradybaena similaris]